MFEKLEETFNHKQLIDKQMKMDPSGTRVCDCVSLTLELTLTFTPLGFLAIFWNEQRRRLHVNKYCKWNPEVVIFYFIVLYFIHM